jgi:septum formation protein
MKKLILASGSPKRKVILERFVPDFEIIPSNFDESQVKEDDPRNLVRRLAYMKAKSVADGKRDSIVIGADTVTYFNGKVIGKPKDREDAKRILMDFSGNVHQVFTGVCVINTSTNRVYQECVESVVEFKELDEETINRVVQNEIILTGAGSYVPEVHGVLFEAVHGSYSNVIGLPTETIVPILEENGLSLGNVKHLKIGEY